MPVIGGYWLWPARIAVATASTSAGSQSKSGKPWPRLIAPVRAASADITVKMVVPTLGSRLAPTRSSEVIGLIFVAAERAQQQRAREAVGQQLGEREDVAAQVGAAAEGHARDVLAEQVAGGAAHQFAPGRIVAHGHLRDDAHAEPRLHVGLDDVGVDRLERDVGLEAALRERGVDAAPSGERRVVG